MHRSEDYATIRLSGTAINNGLVDGARHGCITSVPGAREVAFECLPGSMLPAELRQRFGYDVREAGEGERVLAGAVVEQFARRKDGELEPLVPGSTKPVAETPGSSG
jgi:hypothetical protein